MLNPPRINKNPPDTDVPIIPPTVENPPNFSVMAEEVMATIRQVMITMVECPREKNVPTRADGRSDEIRRRVTRSIEEI